MFFDSCFNINEFDVSPMLLDALNKLFDLHKVEMPCIIFVRKRDEAEAVAAVLGPTWSWVHGGMPPSDRACVADAIRTGTDGITGVVCTDVWATGVDIPNVRSVVMACGGSAPIGLKQRSGRGTRLFGAKSEFVIYDLEIGGKTAADHRARRAENYVEGGFKIDQDLAELFDEPKGRSERRSQSNAVGLITSSHSQYGNAQKGQKQPSMFQDALTIVHVTSWQLMPWLVGIAFLAYMFGSN